MPYKYPCGAMERVIARSVKLGQGNTFAAPRVIGITSPIPDKLDDAALERMLFAPASYNPPSKPLLKWKHVHAELRRGLTPGRNIAPIIPAVMRNSSSESAAASFA